MIEDFQALIAKLFLTVFVIVGVLMGVRYLSESMSLDSVRQVKLITDPALEVLAGAEPPELKGLASRITQFTRVEVAFQIARSAGYECPEPSAQEHSRLRDLKGVHTFYCSHGDEGFKPGDRALLLHAWYPRGFVRGMELKTVTKDAATRPELLADAPALVAARGVEFKSIAPFVDFIVDRFNREYHDRCYGLDASDPTQDWYCQERRKERARVGLPRWDGKPINAGTYESAVGVLKRTGFDCASLASAEAVPAPSPGTEGQAFYTLRCDLRTFSGAVLVASLNVDARTSVPQAFELEVGDERQRVPLTGKPMFDAADVASLLVQRTGGAVQAIALAMDASRSDVERINFADMDADSQRRMVEALLAQMAVVLATPNEPTRIPMLQKLDVAAHMLARFGGSAVWLAERRVGIVAPDDAVDVDGEEAVQPVVVRTDVPTHMLAALGLARCGIDAQASACLAPYVAARPDLRRVLISAANEVRPTLEDLPESSVVRQRLALLDRQLAATH